MDYQKDHGRAFWPCFYPPSCYYTRHSCPRVGKGVCELHILRQFTFSNFFHFIAIMDMQTTNGYDTSRQRPKTNAYKSFFSGNDRHSLIITSTQINVKNFVPLFFVRMPSSLWSALLTIHVVWFAVVVMLVIIVVLLVRCREPAY
jgi:hypothetical protein